MQIKELYLQTADPGQLVLFYRDVLGMQVEQPESDRCIITTRDSILVFDEAQPGAGLVYHFAFNIASNKIQEAAQWLGGKLPLLPMPDDGGIIADFVNWRAQSAYFYDPAGNIVEWIARFDLDDKAPGPFTPDQVYSISEIGLVFPAGQFDPAVEQLMDITGLRDFEKQPPLAGFRALGDDFGLFICVPDNRNWYPTTDCPSAICPLTVRFRADGSDAELHFPLPG